MSAAVPTGPTFAPATTGPGGLNAEVAGDYGWVYFGRPLLFVVVVGVVLLLLRWVFTPERPARRAGSVDSAVPGPRDFGLLVPVATVRTEDDARLLRDVLAGHGIRGTVAPAGADGPPGALHVLVFRTDSVRARSLV